MRTERFQATFPEAKPLIAMIHVQALPGTPAHVLSINQIIHQAVNEARLYADGGFQAIMLENMHDRPYLNRMVGPEITAAMTAVAQAVRQEIDLPLGIQILAGANREALAVALAANLDFIRAEGFVYGHLADEGYMDSDAGELLRYRKQIGAEHIMVFTDIQKKHSSHALSRDINLAGHAESAAFFLSDGLIITGSSTGKALERSQLEAIYPTSRLPILTGSGITSQNLAEYFNHADAFIVGSSLKFDGHWENPPDAERVQALAETRSILL